MPHAFNPYPAVAMAKFLLFGIVVSAIIYLSRDMFGQFLIDILAVLWLAIIFFMLAAFIRSRFYAIDLEDQVISYNAGILSTRKVIIPYSKVTEASFTQTLFQRLFGVGNLNIDTAGGSNVAIHLADVKQADLKMILADINKKTGKDSGI